MAIEMNTSNSPSRIFISSTFEDMVDYRDAAISAITNIEHLPIGMEQFVSSPDKSLDLCLSEVRRCQLFIALVAMRYGSIEENSGKSYSELEYEEALKNGVPVLAFVIDENECPILPKYVDVGENADKLRRFKDKIKQSHNVSWFTSADNLKDLITRSVQKQITETIDANSANIVASAVQPDYSVGAKLFRYFLLLPQRHKDKRVSLRVRLDGKFGSVLVRPEIFEAFNLEQGDTILSEDAVVLGADLSDIDDSNIDLFAEGAAADWILDNELTVGSVLEGDFRLAYESVRRREADGYYKKAALILLKGTKNVSNKS